MRTYGGQVSHLLIHLSSLTLVFRYMDFKRGISLKKINHSQPLKLQQNRKNISNSRCLVAYAFSLLMLVLFALFFLELETTKG